MDPARDSGHSSQPSESLCEIALALAREIDEYERSGGHQIVEDVVLREPYQPHFDPAASTTGRERPGWRWEIVLRDATHTDTVVGAPNGGWGVAGIASLRGQLQHPERGDVVVDVHGSTEGLKPPRPDADSPANRALLGGATGGGYAVGGLVACSPGGSWPSEAGRSGRRPGTRTPAVATRCGTGTVFAGHASCTGWPTPQTTWLPADPSGR